MITIVQSGGDGKPFHYKEFMITSAADVVNLPNKDSDPPVAFGSVAYTQDREHTYTLGSDNVWHEEQFMDTLAKKIANTYKELTEQRVIPLTDITLVSGTVIEAIGMPMYVDDVSKWNSFGLTETGWYVFARILANMGTPVTAETTVVGAAGYIAEIGVNYLDLAVKFEVAAQSKTVKISWAENKQETFIFKATDLAIRNLDYRTTFYVYDLAPFASWEYGLTKDAAFVEGKTYYTKTGDTYAAVPVGSIVAGDPVPPVYHTHAYVLTEDETFQTGKTYYIRKDVYSAAAVTTGEAVDGEYYEHSYVLTEDETFQEGKTYYTESSGTYTAAEVTAGEAVTAGTYYEDKYTLTEDETFQDGKTYYKKSLYAAATVTAGEAVTPETYYDSVYSLVETATFQEGVAYYAYQGGAYTLAEVTAGDSVPAVMYYDHKEITFAGMTRNVTYRLDALVDCPVKIVLPEIQDGGYGAWFEMQIRTNAGYSVTLEPPEGAKVASNTLMNMGSCVNTLDLQYTDVDDVKIWRAMNTQSNFTAAASPLATIAFRKAPDTVSYAVGDALDLTGAEVVATFEDGHKKLVTTGCVFTPASGATLTAEDDTLTASYTVGDVTATATVALTITEGEE